MAGKKRKNNTSGTTASHAIDGGSAPGGPVTAPDIAGLDTGSLPRETVAKVRRNVADGKLKAAIKKAKALHKKVGSAASESLLVGVYAKRIDELRGNGLETEADALEAMVRDRYSSAPPILAGDSDTAALLPKPLAAAVAVIADDNASPARRSDAEDAIRRELKDPKLLATCETVPEHHPLRRAAVAVADAFDVVTRRVTDAEEVALPEVSRRSPLAPWKLLIRAVSQCYRREETACRKTLAAIDPDAAPAPYIPMVRSLLAGRVAAELSSPMASLAGAILGVTGGQLYTALEELDESLESDVFFEDIRAAVRRAITACKKACPEKTELLRQRFSIKCCLKKLPVEDVIEMLDGPSRHDPSFWRLYATAMEIGDCPFMACAAWEEFRRTAVHFGWFDTASLENTAVLLHIVDILERIPLWQLTSARDRHRRIADHIRTFYDRDQPADVRRAAPGEKPDYDYFDPRSVCEKICRYDPAADVYARWIEWEKKYGAAPKRIDAVAKQWHETLPSDIRPILVLAESAEKRRAYRKARGHIRTAEEIDPLNPDLRKASLRLYIAEAVRHIGRRKPHLLKKDIANIEAMAESRDGDLPLLLVALREYADEPADGGGDGPEMPSRDDNGDRAVVTLVKHLLPDAHKARGDSARRTAPPVTAPDRLSAALGRTAVLFKRVGLRLHIPRGWIDTLNEGLMNDDHDVAAVGQSALLAIGEAAIDDGFNHAAYYAAGAGLRRGGRLDNHVLLLRARTMPPHCRGRRLECLDAAETIARRRGDNDMIPAIRDARGRHRLIRTFMAGGPPAIDDDAVASIIENERRLIAFPAWPDGDTTALAPPAPAPDPSDACAAPPSSRSNPFAGTLFDDWDEEEDWEEDWDEDMPDLGESIPGIPPGIARSGMGVVRAYIEMLAALHDEAGDEPTEQEFKRFCYRHPEYLPLLARALGGEGAGLPDVPAGPPPRSRGGRGKRQRGNRRR